MEYLELKLTISNYSCFKQCSISFKLAQFFITQIASNNCSESLQSSIRRCPIWSYTNKLYLVILNENAFLSKTFHETEAKGFEIICLILMLYVDVKTSYSLIYHSVQASMSLPTISYHF